MSEGRQASPASGGTGIRSPYARRGAQFQETRARGSSSGGTATGAAAEQEQRAAQRAHKKSAEHPVAD